MFDYKPNYAYGMFKIISGIRIVVIFRMFYFVGMFALLFVANTMAAMSSNDTASDTRLVESYCTSQYDVCLEQIELQLQQLQTPQLKDRTLLRKAILMIIFGRYQQAESLLDVLTQSPHLQPQELTEAMVHRAKNMFLIGDKQLGEALAAQAQVRFEQMNPEDLGWGLLVEYGNLLLIQEKFRESWLVLSGLLERPTDNIPSTVLADLYANLGHLAYILNRNQLMVEYFRKSFQYTLKQGNEQQNGVSAHNLARAYMVNMDFRRAQHLYLKAIESALKVGDASSVVYNRYHMIKMNIAMGYFRIALQLHQQLVNSDYSVNETVTDEKLAELKAIIYNGLYRDYY